MDVRPYSTRGRSLHLQHLTLKLQQLLLQRFGNVGATLLNVVETLLQHVKLSSISTRENFKEFNHK